MLQMWKALEDVDTTDEKEIIIRLCIIRDWYEEHDVLDIVNTLAWMIDNNKYPMKLIGNKNNKLFYWISQEMWAKTVRKDEPDPHPFSTLPRGIWPPGNHPMLWDSFEEAVVWLSRNPKLNGQTLRV